MNLIVMLEDDRERIDRFSAVLRERFDGCVLNVSRTAPDFIAAYLALQDTPTLIALDHDLFTDSPGDPDPGDGRDVARFLAAQTPTAPVLIHSTNADAADSMLYTLRDAGWNVDRIAPLGEDWIESYWFPYATEMIRGDHD